MSKTRFVIVILLLVLPASTWAAVRAGDPANLRLAYLDPGSGSFVVQALIAALAGIAVSTRLYWTKIKSLLGIETPGEEERDSDHD